MTTLKSGPRILVIGAGSRGHAYARAITEYTVGRIVGVAEPLVYKRQDFCNKFAIPADSPLVFNSWKDILRSEDIVKKEVDGMCVCTLDDTHVEVSSPLCAALGVSNGHALDPAGPEISRPTHALRETSSHESEGHQTTRRETLDSSGYPFYLCGRPRPSLLAVQPAPVLPSSTGRRNRQYQPHRTCRSLALRTLLCSRELEERGG